MKVLAINSSPRGKKGNTQVILTPFLEGAKEAGADVETVFTRDLDIKPCRGEFICWLKTPGECFYKDDMKEILPKIHDADILVFATPVYCDGVTGPLKTLMDRFIPLVTPHFELRDDHCRHGFRGETKNRQLVLVSNCGFWELDNFDPLIVHMKAYCKNASMQFAGALVRPHGAALREMLAQGAPVNDVIEAAKEAGRLLVETREIPDEVLRTVSRDLLPKETFIQIVNDSFDRKLNKS